MLLGKCGFCRWNAAGMMMMVCVFEVVCVHLTIVKYMGVECDQFFRLLSFCNRT